MTDFYLDYVEESLNYMWWSMYSSREGLIRNQNPNDEHSLLGGVGIGTAEWSPTRAQDSGVSCKSADLEIRS